MSVRFILGRAGSGKTRHCVEELLAALEQPDGGRLIFLVPEQASFQMERVLATRAARGGYCRAAVLSFSRLAGHVLDERPPRLNGSGPPTAAVRTVLSANARILALRSAVARLTPELPYYGRAAGTAGFYAQLDGLIENLLRERVSPDALLSAAGGLDEAAARRKTRELARIYAGYLEWVGPQRVDPAERPAVLRERLAGLAWLPAARIWVDGFAGFTGQELETLVMLARHARGVAVTLLLDAHAPAVAAGQRPDSLSLFYRTEQTWQRLNAALKEAGVRVERPVVLHGSPLPRFAEFRALARLEAGLATPDVVAATSGAAAHRADESAESGLAAEDPGGIRVLECATHRDELRAAARFIRVHVGQSGGGLRFRDFAVIARSLEPFAPLIADVFAEYEIPYFLDRRRPLRSHPLCRLVEALFEVLESDFSVAATARLLRTGLLPLSRAAAEALENSVLMHQARGAAAWRQERWDFAGQAGESEPQWLAVDRRVMVAGLEPLVSRAAQGAAASAGDWTRALHETLERLHVRQRLEGWIAASRTDQSWEQAETHRLAWEALCEILDDTHAVLGGQPLQLAEFAALVGAGLRDLTLALAPPTLDQVLVSSIERSRHPEIKFAWVFAFNEGIFPARPPEDELLTTPEREALLAAGLRGPAPRRDEAFGERLLAYIAFTRPSRGLTISYATVAEDGSQLPPSPLLDDVRRALPELAPERAAEFAPPVCVSELARMYLRLRPQRERRAREWRRCTRLQEGLPLGAARAQVARLLRGLDYRNAGETLGLYRPSRDPEAAWSGSPSEIEAFIACPFKHFADYGLRLSAFRGPQPCTWTLGTFAHELLRDVTCRAMRTPEGVRGLSRQRWAALLVEALQSFRRGQPPDLAQRRPELAFAAEFLGDFIGELVAVQAARWQRGRFEPLHCELPFGTGDAGSLPALEILLPGGRRGRLRGRIDRVDVCTAAGERWLLVYDYKPKTTGIRSDFLSGSRLQLFCYLLAARRGLAAEGRLRIGGAFLMPIYPDLSMLGKELLTACAPQDQQLLLYRPHGLFAAEVAELLDEQLGPGCVSAVARMKRRQDGGFDRAQSREVVPAKEIEQRTELARRTLEQAITGILAGEVAAAPLVENRTRACGYCEFATLCRFDRALNRARLAEAVLPKLSAGDGQEGGR